MAGASLLTLLDDIASILDDVALMSKLAAKQTLGVLGDDLALSAQQVSGIKAERELPVIWAVALGSLCNKAILVPIAMFISVFIPWAITPLSMLGGLFLCFEGAEKLFHAYLQQPRTKTSSTTLPLGATPINVPVEDLYVYERAKIRAAIRTDLVLSAEIMTLALGVAAAQPLMVQCLTLASIGVLMTVIVYGLVAAIVKLDDVGLYLTHQQGQQYWRRVYRKIGWGLLSAAPLLMKSLTVIGTLAMFMVGGGMLVNEVSYLALLSHDIVNYVATAALWAGVLIPVMLSLLHGLFGFLAGGSLLLLCESVKRGYDNLIKAK